MQIHECRIGMVVEFGRENGEKTRGVIVSINPKKAKVKTLEARGRGRGGVAGAEWGVPYSMMTAVDSNVAATIKDPADEAFPYSRFSDYSDNCIMEAIVDCYNRLSPEWLTADGERPAYQIHALRGKLENNLAHLFKALGRPVSETVAFDWSDQKRNEDQKKAV